MGLLGWLTGGGSAEWPTDLRPEQFKSRCRKRFIAVGATVEPPTASYDFLVSLPGIDRKWAVVGFPEPRDVSGGVLLDIADRQRGTRYRMLLVTAQRQTAIARAMADERKIGLLHYRDIADWVRTAAASDCA